MPLFHTLWQRLGLPLVRSVRYVRHHWLGRLWPAKRQIALPPHLHIYQDALWETEMVEPAATPTVLAIIPTNGQDTARLQRCTAALDKAAKGTKLRTLLVVCPTDELPIATLQSLASYGEVHALPGPFSYPHSLNAGLVCHRDEDYVLLLNDDCCFRDTGDLLTLTSTIQRTGVACLGPLVQTPRNWETAYQTPAGPQAFHYRTEPVLGCCALWDATWLERVGPFDETFGLGYSLDECDHTQRARRLGARWGEDRSVVVDHAGHASFGKRIRQSRAFRENLERWEQKYPGVHYWGRGREWHALPAINVCIESVSDTSDDSKTRTSLDQALGGFHWTLIDTLSAADPHAVVCIINAGQTLSTEFISTHLPALYDQQLEKLQLQSDGPILLSSFAVRDWLVERAKQERTQLKQELPAQEPVKL